MKTIRRMISGIGLLCLLFVMPVGAQISPNGLDFATTFPFWVGNAKMPAGSYTITQSNLDTSILLIRDQSGSHSAYVEFTPTQQEQPHKSTDVTFKKYGTTEYLNRIWVGGQDSGMQVEPTKAEQKLAASSNPETHSITGKAK